MPKTEASSDVRASRPLSDDVEETSSAIESSSANPNSVQVLTDPDRRTLFLKTTAKPRFNFLNRPKRGVLLRVDCHRNADNPSRFKRPEGPQRNAAKAFPRMKGTRI